MAQQLLQKNVCLTRRVQLPARASNQSRRALNIRAEGRVVREYREDDGKIVDSKGPTAASTNQDIYVQNARLAPSKKMSKELKQQLMNEYVGLGGSEGKAMSQNWFLVMIGIVSVLVISCKMIGAL